MCGIVGAVWTDPAATIDGSALGRMTDLLAHRGPDDAGNYSRLSKRSTPASRRREWR